MEAVLVAAVAFVVMEPVTAATHRWVMHGFGWALHRSHHGRLAARFEANDAFPVMFAAVVCVALWVGFNRPGWESLVPICVGVTLYGAAYALVHDVYIHRRAGSSRAWSNPLLERLADAHRIHHLYGRAPYGMLLPIVPSELRRRASRSGRDPLGARVGGTERIPSVPRA